MNIQFVALFSFVLVTTFTPGPNNISSASMGILFGYKKTVPYLFGIISGFFLVLFLSGLVSKSLLSIFPSFELPLRIIGAIYILWLAWHTFRASYSFDEKGQVLLGYPNGFLLQLLNPKAIVYGLTLYSTFLKSLTTSFLFMAISAILLSVVAFAATSTWALFGAAFRTYLNQPKAKQVINIVLSLLLAYTALEISGVFGLLI